LTFAKPLILPPRPFEWYLVIIPDPSKVSHRAASGDAFGEMHQKLIAGKGDFAGSDPEKFQNMAEKPVMPK